MKLIYTTLLTIAMACALAACSKLSDNGKIDGKWRLENIYQKASTNALHYSNEQNLMPDNVYWNIQLNLLSVTSTSLHNGHTNETIARFAYDGNHLQLTQTYVHFRDRDSLLTDPSTTLLQGVGIRGNACNYIIRRLTSSSMVLCSEMDSLVFYKLH